LELFHLANDPGEKTNLAAEYPAKREELFTKLIQWRKAIGATKDVPRR